MGSRRTFPVYLCPTARSAVLGEAIELTGEEGRHAVTVRRHRRGEVLVLTDGDGAWVRGPIEEVVGRDSVAVRVVDAGFVRESVPRITVVQALAKGDRGEAAVELLTEVGADRIVPWQAERSIAKWLPDRAERGLSRWRRTAQEAAKQSRRPRVPEIGDVIRLADLRTLIAAAELALVLHETAEAPLVELLDERAPLEANEVLLVVGPEGGLTDAEVATAVAHGATPVSLGPTVMRTSTAGSVATALVAAAVGRLSHPNPLVSEATVDGP